MSRHRLGGIVIGLWLMSGTAHASGPPASGPPDLTGFLPVLAERFDETLNRYDGQRGLWSTLPRRGRLIGNARETVVLDHGVPGLGTEDLPDLHVVTPQGLSLRTLELSPQARAAVQDFMHRTGQGDRADPVRYGTAQITTAETWAQRYGYFEIRARVPRGIGRWPAFWMTFAGQGWPPEIDVMEAYGAGLDSPGPRDGLFNTAVFFDARNESGTAVHATPTINPLAEDAESREARSRNYRGGPVFNFVRKVDAGAQGADIYDALWTYAVLWTPQTIRFYFGRDRATLREVYAVPTPDDVHVPMYLIANDQFTTRNGWWDPRPGARDRITRPDNDFLIASITVLALPPDCARRPGMPATPATCAVTEVTGSAGDDDIVTGTGFEFVSLGGGADTVHIRRGPEMKILDGFGPDDRLVLEGFPFVDAADALSRLTQVGADVWLPSGADPFWPNTIVFRETRVEAFDPGQFALRWPVGADIWTPNPLHANAPDPVGRADTPILAGPEGSWLSDRGARRRLVGGPAGDRFTVANPRTTVEERADGGLDTLLARSSTRIPPHVERGIAQASGIVLSGSPAAERLETEADGVTLASGPGDDLMVIAPGLRDVRLRIAAGDGHDRLRGLSPDAGHSLWIAQELRARQASWRIETTPEGARIHFGTEQSLHVEGAAPATLQALIAVQ